MTSAIQSSKHALRKAMRTTLRALPAADIHAQSQAIADHLVAAPFFRRSRAVSCYLSMPSGEVDTSRIVEQVMQAEKALYVPKIDKSVEGKMAFLRVRDEEDLRAFPAGTWGIREPPLDLDGHPRMNALDDSSPSLDLILLPGVAFDGTRSRLGHGKGYYDRFISACTAHALRNDQKRPLLVALALREQILPDGDVPIAEHDWKVDMIVGPDGILGHEEEAESSRGRESTMAEDIGMAATIALGD